MVGREQGFVLAAALLSMLLITALLAAVFFATTEETRTGIASLASERALLNAESALQSTLDALAACACEAPDIGRTTTFRDASGGSSVHITRLDSTLLWIVAESSERAGMGGAVRRVGLFASLSIDSTGSIRVSPIPERGWSELF
jgi:hypothetical protein